MGIDMIPPKIVIMLKDDISYSIAVFILKTSLTADELKNNLYRGLSSSGIKMGRVYQTSLEADEFKISDELNR